MAILRIRNWERYQHYKNRNPLWVKLYATDLMMSADWIQWGDASRVLAIASIALACRYQGSDGNGRGSFEVPTLEYVKASCNLNQLPDFKPLVDSKFLLVIEDDSKLLAELYQDASNLLDRVEESREEESREEERGRPVSDRSVTSQRPDIVSPPAPAPAQEKEGKKKQSVFKPPTLAEVEEYIKEKPLRVVAEKFIDFYESKGWMVGKNKMKDWKAACRMSADWDSMLQAWTAKHGGGGTSVRPEHEKYNRKLRRNRPKSGSSGGEAETQKDDLGDLPFT